jgi:hypothetical protein
MNKVKNTLQAFQNVVKKSEDKKTKSSDFIYVCIPHKLGVSRITNALASKLGRGYLLFDLSSHKPYTKEFIKFVINSKIHFGDKEPARAVLGWIPYDLLQDTQFDRIIWPENLGAILKRALKAPQLEPGLVEDYRYLLDNPETNLPDGETYSFEVGDSGSTSSDIARTLLGPVSLRQPAITVSSSFVSFDEDVESVDPEKEEIFDHTSTTGGISNE